MRGFVEARLEAPRGGDIIVSAAHFDSPVGDGEGAAKAAHLRMVIEWVGEGAREYARASSTGRRMIPKWAIFTRLRRKLPMFGAP